MNHAQLCVCVCVFTTWAEREREREIHIRPEGTWLLESLSSPPSFSIPVSTRPSSRPAPSNHRGGRRPKQRRPPCGGSYTVQCCSCSLIMLWYNAIFLCKYSHINSFHKPLKMQRVRSFTSPCPSTVQHDVGFYIAAKCAKFPRLNGNLVGINST